MYLLDANAMFNTGYLTSAKTTVYQRANLGQEIQF